MPKGIPRWAYGLGALVALVLVSVLVKIGVDRLQGTVSPLATPSATASGVATPPVDPGVGDTASGGHGQDVNGVSCESHEQVAYHVHAHLFILLDGKPQKVSALIGIPLDPSGNAKCFYWLHTHDTSGVIHIESPTQRLYTLGQFFAIWGMPLSRNGVSTLSVPSGDLNVYVDGVTYNDDPSLIQLHNHTQVVIELGRQVAPPAYDFGSL